MRRHHEAAGAEIVTDGPFRAPYVVVDDFMPSAVALEMRATAEMHLGNPVPAFNENARELGLLVRAGLRHLPSDSIPRRCSALV